jgi:hypothetical protein
MKHLWAILLILAATPPALLGISGAGVAQQSSLQPRAESSEDGPPPGGCNPIGVTASGEIVFPMTCREFIERHKAADRESSAAETKPATADASKAPAASEANKARATADVSSPPAAVGANKAPTATDPGKPDDIDAKPAAAKDPADEAARPVTKQAVVAPAPADTVNSAAEPATTAALPKRTRARNRVAGSPGCTRFRTYDAASGTYRDYGGQRRPCP